MYRAEENINSVQESQTSDFSGTVAVEGVPELVPGSYYCWFQILSRAALGKDDYAQRQHPSKIPLFGI